MESAGFAKVVFILGATGTGKSKLAIELATRFGGEIINSDKIQVYKGLDIVTNKVTPEEERMVPHHLLNVVDIPEKDFTPEDFRREVLRAMEFIISRGKVPVIAGGSNSYIEALVMNKEFKQHYLTCFFWLDVDLPVLHSSVSRRVDRMVEAGLVEEVHSLFHPEGDYTSGVKRAIGVPEMDRYFREEAHLGPAERATLLANAIEDIKKNTCKLTETQIGKIIRFRNQLKWKIHRLDATEVFLRNGVDAEEAWKVFVRGPAETIAGRFLQVKDRQGHHGNNVGAAARKDEENVVASAVVPLVVGGLTFPVK